MHAHHARGIRKVPDMREHRVEFRFKKAVEQIGGRALKFVSPGWSGAPDRLVLLPGGRCYFVELKRPDGALRPLQAKRVKEMRSLGFDVRVVSNFEQLDAFIKEVSP